MVLRVFNNVDSHKYDNWLQELKSDTRQESLHELISTTLRKYTILKKCLLVQNSMSRYCIELKDDEMGETCGTHGEGRGV
jgi:hypothetical protein